jgi:hypothetical protein
VPILHPRGRSDYMDVMTIAQERTVEQAWEAAWRYHAIGWAVIPLEPRSKKPAVRWEVYQSRRTTDAEVEAWFTPHGDVGIGIVTGHVSGIVVVDADDDDAVRFLAERLKEDDGPGPPMVKTSRGAHLYYRVPDDERIPTIRNLAPGLDLKAEGSFVVAPPSIHPDGHRYRWLPRLGPRFDLPPLPEWARRLIRERNGKRDRGRVREGPIPEGQRNDTLTSRAGSMRSVGFSEAAIAAALKVENRDRCQPPLDDAEVEKIAASVARYPPGTSVATLEVVDGVTSRSLPFRTAADLLAEGDTEPTWLWEHFLALEAITLIAGWAKIGKSTLVAALVRALTRGEQLLGLSTRRTKVVYLTEERGVTFKPRARWFGWDDQVMILPHHDAYGTSWESVVEQATAKALEIGAEVLVVDTWAPWAGIRGDQENQTGVTEEKIAPLKRAAAQGLAVLIVAHHRKGGGEHGEGVRGSSALIGQVDVFLELERPKSEAIEGTRVIKAEGRFDNIPEEIVIRLEGDQFQALGTQDRLVDEATWNQVVDYVKEHPAADVKHVSAGTGMHERTALRRLQECVDRGLLVRSGRGVTGDPYRYSTSVATDNPLGGVTSPEPAQPTLGEAG